VEFSSPLPQDLKSFLAKLEENKEKRGQATF
jgi:hypothetical protein